MRIWHMLALATLTTGMALAQQQQPAPANGNAFPEDTSNVPVIGSQPLPGGDTAPAPAVAEDGQQALRLLPRRDEDPIISPDDAEPASAADAGESSSSSGALDRLIDQQTPEEAQPAKRKFIDKLARPERQNKQAKPKDPAADDLEVGSYYLEKKNWQAALSRYQSALVLVPENPEVYWGLAEAEYHLGQFAQARGYYERLLDYDPDGPHAKAVRKALKDPVLANVKAASLPDGAHN